MKLPVTSLLVFVLAPAGWGQNAVAPKSAPGATIGGVVRKDPGEEPVKKALIEVIAENQSEGGDYTATTELDGSFRIEGILPGRYHLFAERTGLLEMGKSHARSEGRLLTLGPGQELKDLQIRLQAAAVVRGRVTDEDGDPMAEAQVSVFKQSYKAGRSQWEQVGSERTNDLGEFRIANLAAGNYYVSVSPPPDFKNLIEGAGVVAKLETGTPAAGTSYQTTYYPGTADRGQAAPIQLHSGDEFPVNFSLSPSPSLSIRGSVVNVPAQASASVMLQSRDFGSILNGAEIQKDGSFVIRGVSPGTYTILATVESSVVPMMARESLQVASSIEGVKLVPQPGAVVRGHLRVEGKSRAGLGDVFLSLESSEPVTDAGGFIFGGFSNLVRLGADGSAEWKGVPPGNYYVQVVSESGAGQDWFLKSTMLGGADTRDGGINVNGGTVSVAMVASTQGALVDGVVVDQKSEPVTTAIVVAVPETRLRGRIERYRKTVTDQSGRFRLRGMPPGDYAVFAWESVDGEAYLNPDFVKGYEAQGTSLTVKEGDRKTLQLGVIPAAEEQ